MAKVKINTPAADNIAPKPSGVGASIAGGVEKTVAKTPSKPIAKVRGA